MHVLEEQEEMKKNPGQKKDSFHTRMSLVNGIQKIKDRNCGIYSMENIIRESILESSQLAICKFK